MVSRCEKSQKHEAGMDQLVGTVALEEKLWKIRKLYLTQSQLV
jgi:hypothetical protein